MPAELDSIGPLLWLLGPLAGIGFYALIFLRYRNANKRHAYERETSSDVHNLRAHDAVVNRVRGTRSRNISGANGSNPRSRLGRGTTVSVVPAPSIQSVIDEHTTASEQQPPAPGDQQHAQPGVGPDHQAQPPGAHQAQPPNSPPPQT